MRKGDGVKLTACTKKQCGRKIREIILYRVMCGEEQEELLDSMKGRKNVRIVLYSAVAWLIFMLLFLPIGVLTGIFDFSLREIVILEAGNWLFSAGIICIVVKVMRDHLKRWYQACYLIFWSSMIFQVGYLSNHITVENVWAFLLIGGICCIGGVPYLSSGERGGLFTLLIGVSIKIYLGHDAGKAEPSYLLAMFLMSWWLSKVRYSGYIKESRQKRKLHDALVDAETDAMTGLWNRRGMERNLFTSIPHCIRNELPVALIMIDIDHFKQYNDHYGHAQGDVCIQKVAEQIQKATRRKTDLAGRVGGEEFLIFLTGLDKQGALIWAENLQKEIEQMLLPHAPGVSPGIVTVSMGVQCGIMRRSEDYQQLREKADQELYHAKEQGRSCISISRRSYRSKYMRKLYKSYDFQAKKQA